MSKNEGFLPEYEEMCKVTKRITDILREKDENELADLLIEHDRKLGRVFAKIWNTQLVAQRRF